MPVNLAIPSARAVRAPFSPASPVRTAWWLWPHLLSLDAPAVAVLWQRWWAQSAHVTLPLFHSVFLGLGVWLIYLADRLVDASRVLPGEPVRPRHAFHALRRGPLSACAVAAAIVLAWLTPSLLPSSEFRDGLILLALASLYFWLIHGTRGQAWTAHLPKEAVVGGLFAVGTGFFPWCRHAMQSSGLPAALVLFGGICFCNCALITAWEQHAQDHRNPASLLNAFPRLTTRLRPACLSLAALAGIGVLLTGAAVFVPLILSGLLLAVLDRCRDKLSSDALRVLADAALLTPLLGPLLFWR